MAGFRTNFASSNARRWLEDENRTRPRSSRRSLGPYSGISYSHCSTSSSHFRTRDMNMPRYPNTDLTLYEELGQLDDDTTNRPRRSNRKSCFLEVAIANTVCDEDETMVVYSYGHHAVPHVSKISGKNVTLRQFKTLLSREGNFRYFFKTGSNRFGTLFEEVKKDYRVLPLWEGKILCVIDREL